MSKIFSFLFLLFSIHPHSNAQSQFEIKGKITGISEGTTIYLEDVSLPEKILIDSAKIVNQQFNFKGSIKAVAIHAMLRTADFSDYKFFWLENSVINFEAEKGNFRAARIQGSRTQDEQMQLAILENKMGNEKQADISFIQKYPNSLVSAYILNVYASTWGKDTTQILYQALSADMKKTSYGESILEFITLNKDLKVGDKYVDFSQTSSLNKMISVSDFQGKVILLDFWASWCAPCRQQNPELVKIYEKYKSKGLEIVGISLDRQSEKLEWLDAIKRDGLAWTNVSDLKGDKNKAALIYGISAIPDNFLIDKNGIIVARNLRGQKLKEKIAELLK